MAERINKIGKQFWGITIIDQLTYGKVVAICKCGKTFQCMYSNLRKGMTKSCGCERYKIKHGLCNHPLYKVWEGITNRCYNPNYDKYKWYGGKGVRMCDEWRQFKFFYNWAIESGWVKGLEVDKDIKGNGFLYSPDNCTLVTRKQNMRNTSANKYVEYKGEKKCISEWAQLLKMEDRTLRVRIERGWSIERAFTECVHKKAS